MSCVVIATYNEAGTIERILDELRDYRVIVVDDSSPDGTGELVRKYDNATLISRPGKMGIASAYIRGFTEALKTDETNIIQMDAGGTHRPKDVGILDSAALLFSYDLVIGSRFVQRHRTPYRVDGWTFHGGRTLISLGAAFLMRRLGINVHDATSGFRCWNRTVLERMDFNIQSKGFAFQIELLYQAHKLGASIAEIPIPYRLTNSSFNPTMLKEALSIYWRLRRGHYLQHTQDSRWHL